MELIYTTDELNELVNSEFMFSFSICTYNSYLFEMQQISTLNNTFLHLEYCLCCCFSFRLSASRK